MMAVLALKNFLSNVGRETGRMRIRKSTFRQKFFGTRRPPMPMPSASKPSHGTLGLVGRGGRRPPDPALSPRFGAGCRLGDQRIVRPVVLGVAALELGLHV